MTCKGQQKLHPEIFFRIIPSAADRQTSANYPTKVVILLRLYAKTRRPDLFLLLAVPREFPKSIIFDGRVVKSEMTGLPWTIFGNHLPSKVAGNAASVAKNGRLGIHSRQLGYNIISYHII